MRQRHEIFGTFHWSLWLKWSNKDKRGKWRDVAHAQMSAASWAPACSPEKTNCAVESEHAAQADGDPALTAAFSARGINIQPKGKCSALMTGSLYTLVRVALCTICRINCSCVMMMLLWLDQTCLQYMCCDDETLMSHFEQKCSQWAVWQSGMSASYKDARGARAVSLSRPLCGELGVCLPESSSRQSHAPRTRPKGGRFEKTKWQTEGWANQPTGIRSRHTLLPISFCWNSARRQGRVNNVKRLKRRTCE